MKTYTSFTTQEIDVITNTLRRSTNPLAKELGVRISRAVANVLDELPEFELIGPDEYELGLDGDAR